MNDAFPGPSLKDWALLAASTLFVIGGLAMLPSQTSGGISAIAFFGMCGGVATLNIRRKLRDRHAGPRRVEVVGGVAIRPSRTRAVLLGASVATLGTLLLVFGDSVGDLVQALGGFMALVGSLILAGVALGVLPAGWLRFDPDGLSVAGRGWAYQVPWDAMAQVAPATYQENPVLLIWLRDDARIITTPPEKAPVVRRQFATSRQHMGAPVAIMTSLYGIDLPILLAAVELYAREPSARSGLGRRDLPGKSS